MVVKMNQGHGNLKLLAQPLLLNSLIWLQVEGLTDVLLEFYCRLKMLLDSISRKRSWPRFPIFVCRIDTLKVSVKGSRLNGHSF